MATTAGSTGRTLARLVFESLPALLLALAYTCWSYLSASTPLAASDVVGLFGAAFFFIMWIVGQYLRVSKQLGVDAYLSEIRDGVNHIKGALPVSASPRGRPAAAGFATRALLTEADGALEAGHPRAALMVAGAALEEALRDFGLARGVVDADRAPPSRLIRELDGVLPPGEAERVRRLWELRNRAAHGRIAEQVASENAAEVLAQIRTVTDMLRAAAVPVTGTR